MKGKERTTEEREERGITRHISNNNGPQSVITTDYNDTKRITTSTNGTAKQRDQIWSSIPPSIHLFLPTTTLPLHTHMLFLPLTSIGKASKAPDPACWKM